MTRRTVAHHGKLFGSGRRVRRPKRSPPIDAKEAKSATSLRTRSPQAVHQVPKFTDEPPAIMRLANHLAGDAGDAVELDWLGDTLKRNLRSLNL